MRTADFEVTFDASAEPRKQRSRGAVELERRTGRPMGSERPGRSLLLEYVPGAFEESQ